MIRDLTNFNAIQSPATKNHDCYGGPYPACLRIALAQKKLTSCVRFMSAATSRGEHKKRRLRAGNDAGTSPLLAFDDGSTAAEGIAIAQYLDALGSAPTLTGWTSHEKGVIHMMSKRAEHDLLDALSVYSTMPRRGWDPRSRSIRTRGGVSNSATTP